MKSKKKTLCTVVCMLIVTLIVIIISSMIGSSKISFIDCSKILLSKIPGVGHLVSMDGIREVYVRIIWQVRLPRIILACLVGAGLSIVGVTFQGIFRNPLADPHILGVSSGAALGATCAMLSGITIQFASLSLIGACAFLGALITVFVVYNIAGLGGRNNMTGMLLTGTAVSTLLSSIISVIMTRNEEAMEKIYMWTLGSFSSASWGKVRFLFVFLVVCGSYLLLYARDLDVILTGEDSAYSLGLDLVKIRRRMIIASSLLIAACVSVSGVIGFVGLIIPHCTRLISGPSNRKLVIYSLFSGGVFVILCDTIARTITAPSELPVGVITSICGAPYFVFLLYYNQRRSR